METTSLQLPFGQQLSRRLLCALALLLAVLACPTRGATDAGTSYVLAPNDMIDIKVFQEDDLASTLRVAPAGTIVFPLIGTVNVGGLTPHDAAAAIRSALARDYLVNPQVTVTVTEYGKRRFTVLGQVEKAGTYEMPEREKMTLLDAIAMAGGYTRIADSGKVTLKRNVGGKDTVLRLNAKVMARDSKTTAFEIQPGDVITVSESLF